MKIAGLFKNTGWTLIGSLAPLGFMALGVPILVSALGTERFGILLLCWTLVGYFGILEFGIGRALTQAVSRCRGEGRTEEIPGAVGTGITLLAVVALSAGAVAFLAAPSLTSLLASNSLYQEEATTAVRIVSVTLPLVILGSGAQGILEAYAHFRLITLIRVSTSGLSILGSAVLVQFVPSLVGACLALLISRAIAAGTLLGSASRCVGGIRYRSFSKAWAARLFRFGGWLTVSGVVSPVMVNMDRFLVGAIVGGTAVAYYATPSEIALKLLVLPSSLITVLFPLFGESFHRAPEEALRYFRISCAAILAGVGTIALFGAAAAPEALALWLGSNFATHSAPVLSILLAGIIVVSVAMVPFVAIQAMGRSDITAKIHLMEVLPYLAVVWLLTDWLGILGTAVAWVLRVASDLGLLFYFAEKQGIEARTIWRVLIGLSGIVSAIVIISFSELLSVRCALGGVGGLGAMVLVWLSVITREDRSELIQHFGKASWLRR